ncbi:hypothetical protein KSE1242_22890 (plasmid) [Staphylococcus epidermidis]
MAKVNTLIAIISIFLTGDLANIVEKMGAEIEKNNVKTVTPCPIAELLLLKLLLIEGINPATI